MLSIFKPLRRKFRRHDPFDILEAIVFVVITGCQWKRIPVGYPPATTVYYHFRSWNARIDLTRILNFLVEMKRQNSGNQKAPTLAVIDSQSVRTGLCDSVSGIDGGKRVKGIKRHIAVDKNGWPLAVHVTTANIHDSRGAGALISSLLCNNKQIRRIKADFGYRGCQFRSPLVESGIILECVKSNFGTNEFIPIDGRWVVERMFSWLQNYRRLMRNYERFLSTAKSMTLWACILFMLRYF